jgi:IS5 family transposase
MFACPATDDFFRSRIDHMIDLRHPLAVLAARMPWQEIEALVAQVFSRKGRAGVAMPDLDLFGEQVQRVAVASNAGLRIPLMADSDSIPIADSVPCDGGHAARVS